MQVSMNNEAKQVKKSLFDPRKDYEWQPDTEFIFNGNEFGTMYRAIGQFLSGNLSPATIMRVTDAYAVLQVKMMDMVNAGILKEMEQDATRKTPEPSDKPDPEA